MESGFGRRNGLAALPRAVSVLRCQRQAVLPAYQRSADIFLGVPFNIASYALLTMMMAQVCGWKPVSLFIRLVMRICTATISSRPAAIKPRFPNLPTMKINPEVKDLFAFKFEDFELEGYDPHPHIKAAVSV